jgi:hypothetical protein
LPISIGGDYFGSFASTSHRARFSAVDICRDAEVEGGKNPDGSRLAEAVTAAAQAS